MDRGPMLAADGSARARVLRVGELNRPSLELLVAHAAVSVTFVPYLRVCPMRQDRIHMLHMYLSRS